MGSASSCVAQSPNEAPRQTQSLYDWSTVSIMCGSDLRSFLLSNYDDINWSDLSQNRHGLAMIILEENYEHIDWTQLSRNSSYGAIRILRKNQDKIIWRELSMNKSVGAEKLLRVNLDKVSWDMVCLNPSRWAMKLLLENPSHINMCIITHFLISNAHFTGQKNTKKCKINSRNFTYDGLTLSCSSFVVEPVKDEI